MGRAFEKRKHKIFANNAKMQEHLLASEKRLQLL